MQTLTLLDLIEAVGECADTPDELKAVVVHLFDSGKARLAGEHAGYRLEFYEDAPDPAVVVASQTELPQQTLDQAG